MKSSKKIIALLLALCMTAVLCACGQAAAPAPAAPAEPAAEQAPAQEAPAQEAPALDFPTKNITICVPYEAGGSADVAARIFAEYFSKEIGVGVDVINIVGSAGALGAQELAKQNPDGYYLLITAVGFPVAYAFGGHDFTYEDYAPVARIFSTFNCFCVNSSSPYETFEQFIEAAQSNEPGFMKTGSLTNTLATMVLFAMQNDYGIEFSYVDLAGNAKSAELLSGRIDAYPDAFAQMKPYIDSGDFRPLAIMNSAGRYDEYPDIPTFAELGMDYPELDQTWGVWTVKGTDPAIIDYLSEKIGATLENEELKAEWAEITYFPSFMPTAEYTDYMKLLYTRLPEIVQLAQGQQG